MIVDYQTWIMIGLKIYAVVKLSNFLIVLAVLLVQRKLKR